MNYAQKNDLFVPFFTKVVVKKSQAYSFLIIGIMHLQKILLSFIMLRFHFFTATQGTWVHKDDRGPLFYTRSHWYFFSRSIHATLATGVTCRYGKLPKPGFFNYLILEMHIIMFYICQDQYFFQFYGKFQNFNFERYFYFNPTF